MDDLDLKLLVDLLKDRITPDKDLGQHFLLDESVVYRSIEIANSPEPMTSDSRVIEIGPGTGNLTKEIIKEKPSELTLIEKDEKIKGHDGSEITLPIGTYCQIINWTRHRNVELWGPDVNEFNPDREFKDSEIWSYEGFGTYNLSSDRFSPFTYGPRNCIGKNFSHMEMRLILLHLFKNHDFTLEKKQAETIEDPKYMGLNTFTMGPADIYGGFLGMYMNIHLRKSKI